MTVDRANVPCGSCHLCCGHDVILLVPEQGDVIADYEHDVLPGGLGAMVKKGPDGNCIYLGPAGCTIHDRAPAICRAFDCRRFFLSRTRNERRAMVRQGIANAEVFEAGRSRLSTLEDFL